MASNDGRGPRPPDVDVEILYAVPDTLPATLPETAWVLHESPMVTRAALLNYVTAEWFWADMEWRAGDPPMTW